MLSHREQNILASRNAVVSVTAWKSIWVTCHHRENHDRECYHRECLLPIMVMTDNGQCREWTLPRMYISHNGTCLTNGYASLRTGPPIILAMAPHDTVAFLLFTTPSNYAPHSQFTSHGSARLHRTSLRHATSILGAVSTVSGICNFHSRLCQFSVMSNCQLSVLSILDNVYCRLCRSRYWPLRVDPMSCDICRIPSNMCSD